MNWGRQAGAFDETFEASGDVRPHYRTALSILQGFSPDEIERRERLQKLALLNQGITFTVYGEKDGIERIFPFDFVPRIIPAAEWRRIEAGLVQRITTLGLFLLDVYGEQKCLKDGVLPAELVYSRKEYKRELLRVIPPRKIFTHIVGTGGVVLAVSRGGAPDAGHDSVHRGRGDRHGPVSCGDATERPVVVAHLLGRGHDGGRI